jgi:hypothetical protein
MFGLFRAGRFLEAGVEDWVLETWAWLLTEFGGLGRLRQSALVLPTRDFFPPTDTVGDARALYLFQQVKLWAGLADWPCELEAFDRPAGARVAQVGAIRHGKSANGTFRIVENRAVISYASDLVSQPAQLIATLAHELAHYLLLTKARTDPPGGPELEELATDLAVAYLGFGVFGANAAFTFGQHGDAFSQGWASSRSGYLSERSWAFALALFCTLKDKSAPTEHLKDALVDPTRKAMRYLERHATLLAPLRDIA